MLTLDRLLTLLHLFPHLTIGLVGDLFLDRYLEMVRGVQEYSLETGLEAYQVARVRNQPGALGTVMNNLAALGAGSLLPVTVIGDDGHGHDLLQELATLPAVDPVHVLRSGRRLTPTYTKPLKPDLAGGWQEQNRLDIRSREPLASETLALLCGHVREVFRRADGLIVLDQIDQQNEGVVHDAVRCCLRDLSLEQPSKLIYVDSRRGLARFDFGTLKGNAAEVLAAVPDQTAVPEAACRLAARTARPVYCTLGAAGSLVAYLDGRTEHARGYPVPGPVDVVGAGDSATSGIVLSLLAGADALEAASVGNLVASITVQQLGTTGTASPQQVLHRWHETRI